MTGFDSFVVVASKASMSRAELRIISCASSMEVVIAVEAVEVVREVAVAAFSDE